MNPDVTEAYRAIMNDSRPLNMIDKALFTALHTPFLRAHLAVVLL